MKYSAILIVENTNITKSLQTIRDNVSYDDFGKIYIFANASQRAKVDYEFFDLKNKIEFSEDKSDDFLKKRLSVIDETNSKSGMQIYFHLYRLNNKFLIIGDLDDLDTLKENHPKLECDAIIVSNPNKKLQLVSLQKNKTTGFLNSKNLFLGLTVAAVSLFAVKHDLRIVQSFTNILSAKFK